MACATTGENIPSLREFLLYFLRLGTFGFGGPIALAGHMQHDLVETRKWISPQDYREGLALSQLSPGPLAAQPLAHRTPVPRCGRGRKVTAKGASAPRPGPVPSSATIRVRVRTVTLGSSSMQRMR